MIHGGAGGVPAYVEHDGQGRVGAFWARPTLGMSGQVVIPTMLSCQAHKACGSAVELSIVAGVSE